MERLDLVKLCSRDGYCKDGYCTYTEPKGDVTPGRRLNRDVLVDVVTPIAEIPCMGGCGTAQTPDERLAQLLKSNEYRHDEAKKPPRFGDPRLGVNQDYDAMPYDTFEVSSVSVASTSISTPV